MCHLVQYHTDQLFMTDVSSIQYRTDRLFMTHKDLTTGA